MAVYILASLLTLQVAFAATNDPLVKQKAADAVAKILAATNAVPAAAGITAPPRFQRRQASEALSICSVFQTSFLRCEGDFITPYALCGCYTSGTYAPDYVDGLARTCSQYIFSLTGASAAAPFASFTSFCTSVGDVAASLTSSVRDCSSRHSINRACATEASNLDLYGTLSARAACACYSGTKFSGTINDKWASTCYSQASLANTPFATDVREYTALCSSLGDVRASALDLSANCGRFETVFSSCSSDVVDFPQLPATEQASCLCYSGAEWIAAEADNAVGTCLQYASSNFQHRVSLYSPYEGLCNSAGDVRAQAQTTGPGERTTRVSPAPTASPGPDNTQGPQQDSGSKGLSGGALAGAVVGAICGTALLAVAGFIFWRRRNSSNKPLPPPPVGYGGLDGDGTVGGVEAHGHFGGIADKDEYQSVPVPPPPVSWTQNSMR